MALFSTDPRHYFRGATFMYVSVFSPHFRTFLVQKIYGPEP